MKARRFCAGLAVVAVSATVPALSSAQHQAGESLNAAAARSLVLDSSTIASPAAPNPAESAQVASPPAGQDRMDTRAALTRAESPAREAELSALMAPTRNEARAMVIVGGLAILTGAVIDGSAGDVIMVGGAVVGLIGLYHYLK